MVHQRTTTEMERRFSPIDRIEFPRELKTLTIIQSK